MKSIIKYYSLKNDIVPEIIISDIDFYNALATSGGGGIKVIDTDAPSHRNRSPELIGVCMELIRYMRIYVQAEQRGNLHQ